MAADRRLARRDYAWRGPRCIILRSGDIAVRTTPAAGRCVRAVVTSDGIGGTDGLGGTVPLVVTSEGNGGTGGLGGAVPLGMGAAGWWLDPDPGGVRLVRARCLPLAGGGRRSVLGDRVG